MKSGTRQTAVVLLAVIALFGSACGGSEVGDTTAPPSTAATTADREDASNTTTTSTADTKPAAQPSGTITLWGWSYPTMVETGLIEAFNAEYPEVEVEIVEYNSGDTYQNLSLAVEAGEGLPDVVMLENSHLAGFVEQGGLLDITDRAQPYLDVMNDYKWIEAEKDGEIYAMPWDSGPVVLYYRRDILDAAGLASDADSVNELVSTWDGYLELCKTVQSETGLDCFSLSRANNDARLFEIALWQQGLGYYNEAGEVTVDSPRAVATLEKFGEFWDADVVSDEQPWTDPWYTELAEPDISTGTPVASIVEASWLGVFLKTWIAGDTTSGLWGVARMPAFEEGQPRAANDGGSTLAIPARANNPDAAWAFIEFTLGRRDSQLAMFEYSDFLPSLETTYDAPLFEEPEDFFGGQVVRTLYRDVVDEIPQALIYGPDYTLMNSHVALAIQKYATGELSASEALGEAAESIREETGLS